MLLSILSLALSAADSWTPKCDDRKDPSVWFILSAAAAPETKDFTCPGLFFDTTSCTVTVGLGKIKVSGQTPGGYPTYELRYLPYGNLASILGFLEKPAGGVLYKPPTVVASGPGAVPLVPQPAELLRGFLEQRNKASAATKGVTLNVWTCPDAPFTTPDDITTPVGMITQRHTAVAPVVDQ